MKPVQTVLSWYPTLTPKQKANLLKLLNAGRTGGSGKLVILPVDQGFEHGPARSFFPNPAGFDPRYHAQLAIDAGCSGYAAPLGAVEAAADLIAKAKLPTILKINNHDLMMADDADPKPAVTSWVDDAARLGCVAVGMTIYPGSAHAQEMYQVARQLAADARKAGVLVVLWSYPRGSGLPDKESETAVDVVSYGVHIAAQLGAHIIKCKPPTDLIALHDHKKKDTYKNVATETLADRTKLLVQAAFNGRRLLVNSGGDTKDTASLLEEIKQLRAGGSSGSIVGRNSFQRPHTEAVQLLNQIQDIFRS